MSDDIVWSDTPVWEEAAIKSKKVPYGRATALSVFPNARITDDIRPAKSTLGRKNPNSKHVTSENAVDMEAIPGMTFDQARKAFETAGHSLEEARDEYKNPSRHATGPHWHFAFKGGDGISWSDTPTWEDAPSQAAPAPLPVEATPVKPRTFNQEVAPAPQVSEATIGDVNLRNEYVLNEDSQMAVKDIQNRLFSLRLGKTGKQEVIDGITKDYGRLFPQMTPDMLRYAASYYEGGGKAPVDFYSNASALDAEKSPTAGGAELSAPPPLEYDDIVLRRMEEMSGSAGRGVNAALGRTLAEAMMGEEAFQSYIDRVKDERGDQEIFWEDQSRRTDSPISDAIGGFVGDALGDINPTYLLSPGGTPASRVLSQGLINAGSDVPVQLSEMSQGLQEEYNPTQTAVNFAAGAAFQGAAEGLGYLARQYKGRGVEVTEFSNPKVVETREPSPVEATVGKGGKPTVKAKAGTVARVVAEETSSWKNSPEFAIHTTKKAFEKAEPEAYASVLADGAGKAPAFVASDGRIHIIADNIKAVDYESYARRIVFHEALGHSGLAKKFADELDPILSSLHENSWKVRKAADEYLARNPTAYEGRPDRLVRAVEEVLAESSEKGLITKGFRDKLRGHFQKWSAQLTGKPIRYTDKDVRGLLADAHSTIVNGTGEAAPSGNRYMYVGLQGGQQAKGRMPERYWDAVGRAEAGERVGPGSDVRKELGWFQAPDGRWRKEISDLYATFNSGRTIRGPLHSYFNHPELYKHYPELASVNVERVDEGLGAHGYFDRQTNTININPTDSPSEQLSTVLHEVQHWIQEKEGFSMGGAVDNSVQRMSKPHKRETAMKAIRWNKKEAKTLRDKADAVTTVLDDPLGEAFVVTYEKIQEAGPGESYPLFQQLDELESRLLDKYAEDDTKARAELAGLLYELKAYGPDDLRYQLKDRASRHEGTIRRLEEALSADKSFMLNSVLQQHRFIPDEAYRQLFGEAEARDVERRRGMTPEQRKRVTPYSSEVQSGDVDPSGYIFDEGMTDYGTSRSESNRYMMDDGSGKPTDREGYVSSLKLDTVTNDADMIALFKEAGKDLGKSKMTVEDAELEYQRQGLTPGKLARKALRVDPSLALGISNALGESGRELVPLYRKINRGEATPKDLDQFQRKFLRHRALLEKAATWRSDTARALYFMRVSVADDASIPPDVLRQFNAENISGENLYKLAELLENHKDSPEATNKIVNDAFSPYWEEWVTSFRYNMMLYSPWTQARIFTGSAISTLSDSAAKLVGSIASLPKALVPGAERLHVRDAIWRNAAFIKAYVDYNRIWNDATFAAREGHPPHQVSRVEQGRPMWTEKFGAAGTAVDAPIKAIAVQDALWRMGMEAAFLYDRSAIQARREGLKGAAFRDRVDELMNTSSGDAKFKVFHTKSAASKVKRFGNKLGKRGESVDAVHEKLIDEMEITDPLKKDLLKDYLRTIEREKLADDDTATLQLVDDPGMLGLGLESIKRRPGKEEKGKRLARFLVDMILPFSRVTSNTARAMIRYLPGVSAFERTNARDWSRGGPEADVAIGRQIVGAAFIGWVYQKFVAGEITDDGPEDYRLRAQMEAEGWQPNSVKIDGKWVDVKNLDVAGPMIRLTANIAGKHSRGEYNDEDYINETLDVFGDITRAVANTSFGEQLQVIAGSLKEGDTGETTTDRLMTGLASSFVPTGLRQATEASDGFARDTRGDLTTAGRIEGRVSAAIPGMREDLPLKYDVYGRPVPIHVGPYRMKEPDTDPVILEISRLTKVNGKSALIDPVNKNNLPEEYKDVADSEMLSEFQRLSGEYILESLREIMDTESWKDSSDEDKIKTVRKVKKDQRKNAREDLFAPTIEGETDGT